MSEFGIVTFFVWFGLMRLLRGVNDNVFARYVMTVVFVAAVFLWAITYVYTPSVTLLLLALLYPIL